MFQKGGSRGWVTTRDITWHIGKKQSGWMLIVPAGREFESSVPWWLTWLLSRDDPRLLLAAVVHDDLLESGHRAFFAAGEWYDAALKGGAGRWFALPAATLIAVRGAILHRRRV